MSVIRNHPWLTGVLLSIVIIVLGCAGLFVYVVSNISLKSSAPRSYNTPSQRTGDAQPILQLEDHTCGLLALSAAYRLYELSPDDKNLRYRLGVDVAANPLDSTSTGTLHPDLLRVIAQDGFSYAMPSPGSSTAADELTSHLESGDAALLLIRRQETGGLHWVLADDGSKDQLRIVDSLQPEPLTVQMNSYLTQVLSIILIKPDQSGAPFDMLATQRDGTKEMARIKDRLDRLKRLDK